MVPSFWFIASSDFMKQMLRMTCALHVFLLYIDDILNSAIVDLLGGFSGAQ